MILFFDTETTGLPDWLSPSDAKHQPHIVQLAMLLTDDHGQEIRHHNVIVKPDGYEIPLEVSRIHGITQEMAMDKGIPAKEVMEMWLAAREESRLRVAHNTSFDDRITRIAMLRHGLTREAIEVLENAPSYCTMMASTNILNLAPTGKMLAAGFIKPKPPKLAEAYKYFFNEDLAGAHDAMVDMRACSRIYFHLNRPVLEEIEDDGGAPTPL